MSWLPSLLPAHRFAGPLPPSPCTPTPLTPSYCLPCNAAVIPLYFYLRPSKIYSTGAAEVWIAKLCGVTAAGCSVFLLPPVTKTLTDNLR